MVLLVFGFCTLVVSITFLPSSSSRYSANCTSPNKPIIILDPGHGGTNAGARGINNLAEKDLNLKMAFKIRNQLLLTSDYDVLLTRTDDSDLTLDNRATLANKYCASSFISIHANASQNHDLSGVETFWPTNLDINDPSYDFKNWQLLITSVHKNMRDYARTVNPSLLDRGIKPANFQVLLRTKMPACLAEVGFIDHPEEGRLLASSKYQDQLAIGIAEGIAIYTRFQKPHL